MIGESLKKMHIKKGELCGNHVDMGLILHDECLVWRHKDLLPRRIGARPPAGRGRVHFPSRSASAPPLSTSREIDAGRPAGRPAPVDR